jgi:hypothetical protein
LYISRAELLKEALKPKETRSGTKKDTMVHQLFANTNCQQSKDTQAPKAPKPAPKAEVSVTAQQ